MIHCVADELVDGLRDWGACVAALGRMVPLEMSIYPLTGWAPFRLCSVGRVHVSTNNTSDQFSRT